MSTATASEIVGIVKDRTALRTKATRFFLDNARRMWGLPADADAEPPLTINVSHSINDPPTLETKIPATVPPTTTPVVPVTTPVASTLTDKLKAATLWIAPPAAVVAAAGAWWAATHPAAPEKPTTEPPAVVEPTTERPGSLLQYLEDMGEHRP